MPVFRVKKVKDYTIMPNSSQGFTALAAFTSLTWLFGVDILGKA